MKQLQGLFPLSYCQHLTKGFILALTFWCLITAIGILGCAEIQTPGALDNYAGLQSDLVARPEEMLTISSVYIYPVSYDANNMQGLQENLKQEIYRRLTEAFKSESNFDILYDEKVYEKRPGVALGLIADSVLFTEVTSYVERQGSRIGTSVPAKIDFNQKLIRRIDNKVLWMSSFHFRDRALSENLLQIGNRLDYSGDSVGWLQASKVIEDGFIKSARKLNELRLEQFSKKTSTIKHSQQ
jgi:hypothetical protein